MATYSATGLAIFDSSLDPPIDNRPKLLSAQSDSASVSGQPPTSCTKCCLPDFAAPDIRPAASGVHDTLSPDTRHLLDDRSAYPTPRTTQRGHHFFTPSEVYHTPHDVLSSCATTSLYLSPMDNPNTPTSTYGGIFSTPETTPAISYDENTKRSPNIHRTPHTAGHPSTVEGSGFSPPIYRTPFELDSNGAIDYRPTTIMIHTAPTSSIDIKRRSSFHSSSETPLEQDFLTPEGSPLSPYHTPHNGSPELPLEFQPSVGYRASPTFGHPLNFLSFSSPSSLGTPQGIPTKHHAATPGSTHPSTTSNKEERSPTLEDFQSTRLPCNQKLHTTPLRRSRSSISPTNAGPTTTEGSSLRAREIIELAHELQKARAITEDFVRFSPEKDSLPQNSGLARGHTLGNPPSKYGRDTPTMGGSFFKPSHARFSSNSTASTAFFDIEEKGDDEGIADEMKPGRRSLSIITAWPTRAATPPPLLSPFKEKSNAARGDGPLRTPNTAQEGPMACSTPVADSPVLLADADQALLKRTQSQSNTSSTVGTSPRSSSSYFKEGLRVQDTPAIVVEHPSLGHKIPMGTSELLAEECRTSSRINDTQVLRKPTINHGFTESSSTALGLSPSIYLSPMHEARFSNNSLDLAKVIKPEIERGLSTPSFISGVLQAGLLLEKLERENTTSFEEDTEAVHFQVLTAVIGMRKQASSSSSLSHYSTHESPEHSQLHLLSLGSTSTTYVTATDLSTAAQPSLDNAPASSAPLHNPDSPSNPPPHLTLPPTPTFVVGPLPRPSSILVSDPTNFVHGVSKGVEVDQGTQLLKPVVDTTEPISTGVESGPSNGFLSVSDPTKVSVDTASYSRKSGTEVEGEPIQGVQVVIPSRVRVAATRSTGQSLENHLSSPQCTSTLRPLSTSGSASVSPVSPSSVISRASARLTNPFSFLHPSPLSLMSPHSSDVSLAGPRRPLKTPEQSRSHKRGATLTPGDMKRPSSARHRLSRFLGGVDLGVGKASSPTSLRDKADAEPVGPDVFGAGEGRESWIRESRERTTNHGGPDREAATVVQEGKNKKKSISIRPASMIWLGSNKEKPPVAARDGKKSTKVPLESHRSTQPPPSSDPNSWSMLDSGASSAVRNNEGLRIINLPPPPAIGATIDVPRSRKSWSRRKSVAISSSGEESEAEVEQMKGQNRSRFLRAFIRK